MSSKNIQAIFTIDRKGDYTMSVEDYNRKHKGKIKIYKKPATSKSKSRSSSRSAKKKKKN
jgi:hypothetical protein